MKNDKASRDAVKIGAVIQIAREMEGPAAFKFAIIEHKETWGVRASYMGGAGMPEIVSPTWEKFEVIGDAVWDHAGKPTNPPLALQRHHE